MAALISGPVDFVIDPPFQDVARLKQEGRFKLADTTDIGTQYLGFDQSRDELQFSDVKGRNPFKDLRVRRAVYQAIDIDAIVSKVLRGQAIATGSFFSRLVDGYVPELDRRLPYDVAAGPGLPQEAGDPRGFGVALDCADGDVLSQAHTGNDELLRGRLVAVVRRMAVAHCALPYLLDRRHRHLQRRALLQPGARQADRCDSRGARRSPAPSAGRRGSSHPECGPAHD